MRCPRLALLSIAITLLLLPVGICRGQTSSSPKPGAGVAADGKPDLLPADMKTKIDKAAEAALKKDGLPSVSLAVVREGKLAYARAYGMANVKARKPATTAMRYSIGSISKQFAAAAILLLAEEGKLSLKDPVSRWFPDLTRAGDVTVRQLLSMTSGFQDYWPEDYVMPTMMKPESPEAILKGWAQKPLDFEPGTKWQYSNTNYVIAGLIVERITGMSLIDFLHRHVFGALGMKSVFDTDAAPLPAGEPERYLRYGLGPVRPAPKEGKGWMFAAGELAMTATDLAKWDISMIDRTILKPDSYFEMEKAGLLRNGAGTQYGLGVAVSLVNGRRLIAHGGEVSGFTAENAIYPDEQTAVVVQTNLDATHASISLANEIAALLFMPVGRKGPLAEAKAILAGLQQGKIDRSRFTANAYAYFSDRALKDLAASLAPLGKPDEFKETSEGSRGGMTFRRYRVEFPKKNLAITTYTMADGKLEQYIVAPEN
jgi:D-alanyl-D-alanine carboxypeptidase